ncbi:MAG: hypothetical protein J6W06_02780 [Bacteroidales bacterium]|jgi:hypothetical protein|nr:hypothetical protein [Bacteroidales bacterium]
MKKLVFLTILTALAMCLYSCKEEPKENNEPKEECAKEICPVHDAVTILETKNSIANLIKDAIADNEITDEEATKINDAFCEYQSIDAEIKTKYQDKKDAQTELFAILNAADNYNKSMKLATEANGYDKIGSKVK